MISVTRESKNRGEEISPSPLRAHTHTRERRIEESATLLATKISVVRERGRRKCSPHDGSNFCREETRGEKERQ